MIQKAHNLNLVENIRAIKAEMARLQGLLDEASRELLDNRVTVVPKRSVVVASKQRREKPTRHSHGSSAELVEGSTAFWAAEAIRQAGKPLHAKELVRAIEEHGHKVKQNTLMGSLFRWVKKKAVFYRAGKNTFGLIEMKKG